MNAATALRRLRSVDQPRLLWADCICINQNNTSVRSSQVNLMDENHSNAERGLMWLSEDPENQTPIA